MYWAHNSACMEQSDVIMKCLCELQLFGYIIPKVSYIATGSSYRVRDTETPAHITYMYIPTRPDYQMTVQGESVVLVQSCII